MGSEHKLLREIIKNHDEIVEQTKAISKQLNKKFHNQEAIIVIVLKGGLPFAFELVKHLTFDVSFDFIESSSYFLDKQVSIPKTRYEAKLPIKNKNVIIVDDLVDSGNTLKKIINILTAYEPKEISVVALYGKPKRINLEIKEYYCWEEDPNGFLFGFGLDYNEKYRNLPYIAIMKGR